MCLAVRAMKKRRMQLLLLRQHMQLQLLQQAGGEQSAAALEHQLQHRLLRPAGPVDIGLFPEDSPASAPVSFRFTVLGGGASYQIDDVYVDPWCRR